METNPNVYNFSLDMVYQVYNETTNEEPEGDDDLVIIGYFSTGKQATDEIERLRSSGFLNDNDRRYGISTCVLNRTRWEGRF
jgi:hypothetical protein